MGIEIREMTEEDIKRLTMEHEQLNPKREVSESVKESLELYANQGVMPGSFLVTVLENDLFGALARADSYNRATIFQITKYIYYELPRDSYGSREKVKAYLAKFNQVEK